MRTIDLTWLWWMTLAVVVYYMILLALSARRPVREARARDAADRDWPFMVLVIPAHNEEAVIGETLSALEKVAYRRWMILVMNDGSTDRTGEIARGFSGRARVVVVDRDADVAGRGKGAVLNHAFRLVAHAAREGGRGAAANNIVVGVMDADGQLEPHALARVAPFFGSSRVGGVQIGVRIANVRDNFLTRMQDMEFVGFSSFVQQARDALGSVGLGGNGQFTRLAALESLGREPWTDCLTEDLDLGLALVERGWRIRFCPQAYVAQQGVRRLDQLLRQRTRWFQGHYQCWRHVPHLASSPARLRTKVDLCVYLFMVGFVVVIFTGLVASVLSVFGVVTIQNHFLDGMSSAPARNLLLEIMSIAPLVALVAKYQRHTRAPLQLWELPAYAFAFGVYTYLFMVSQGWAWGRLLCRRGSWAKTPRVRARAAV